ncbi:MAG: hypothetical protein DRR19_00660 [Candidatus Parabeggiatoa sp. nov. 1]|nr:MAG: hypothetical protein DRR19_00660 [Gammaproteobacteria bacterium]
MKNDPVLNRIQEARHIISMQCDHEPKKLVAYYLQRQKNHQSKLFNDNKNVDVETNVECVKRCETKQA